MVRYANVDGVPYAGLTDGDHWEFYEVFKQEPLEDRCLLQVSIAHDPTHECALKLLLLWRPNLSSVQPTQTNKPIVVAESEPNPEPAKAPPSMLGPKNTEWVALAAMFRGKVSGGAGDPPLTVKFPDKSEDAIHVWRDVLVNTAEWLSSKGLLANNIPVLSAKGKHYIVNKEKKHPSGSPFERPQRLKEGLWVEARGGKDAIRTTCHLLRACGQNPAEVLALVAKKLDSA